MSHDKQLALECASICLKRYLEAGRGEDLFSAYSLWRDSRATEPEWPAGKAPYDCCGGIGDQILHELDEVVSDLLHVFSEIRSGKTGSGGGSKTDLRRALRIDKGRGPEDGLHARQVELHIELMRHEYKKKEAGVSDANLSEMARTVSAFVKQAPGKFGVLRALDERSIRNHWRDRLSSDDVLRAWVEEVDRQSVRQPKDFGNRSANSKREAATAPKASSSATARGPAKKIETSRSKHPWKG